MEIDEKLPINVTKETELIKIAEDLAIKQVFDAKIDALEDKDYFLIKAINGLTDAIKEKKRFI